MPISLPVVNIQTATFECTFGRGCDGLCCRNGRPSVDAEERERIDELLERVEQLLRPEAQKVLEKEGYVSGRKKLGEPMLRVVDSWCIFFNEGCTLHKLGAEDGDALAYKPLQCAIFPLEPNGDGTWYVRQWDYNGERWDLFCLNPNESKTLAKKSLKAEMLIAAKAQAAWDAEEGE